MSRKQHYFVPRLESWRETSHMLPQRLYEADGVDEVEIEKLIKLSSEWKRMKLIPFKTKTLIVRSQNNKLLPNGFIIAINSYLILLKLLEREQKKNVLKQLQLFSYLKSSRRILQYSAGKKFLALKESIVSFSIF